MRRAGLIFLIERRSTASHQIGTTVRVAKLFERIPVRRQTTEKNASKCLASIRKLLQAYALARPNVRFQLRVLKAKNERSNFSYGPKTSGATVQDAAFKVIGKDPASQCSWSVLEVDPFEIQALLPTTDATSTKISSVGHFISVDYRPVSTSQGLFKQISKCVLESMRASNALLSSVKNPFFVMNIICPRGSYDPNVEPAKDDVIFNDGSEVLKAVDGLLSAVYPRHVSPDFIEEVSVATGLTRRAGVGRPAPDEQTLSEHEHLEENFEDDNDDFETVQDSPITHLQPVEEQIHTKDENYREAEDVVHGTEIAIPDILADTNELEVLETRADIWRPSMYGCDEDDPEPFGVSEQSRPDSAGATLQEDDGRDLNPWTIAKMNISVRPRVARASGSIQPQPSRARSQSPTPSRLSYIPQEGHSRTSIPSDNTQLPALPWQRPAQHNDPFASREMSAQHCCNRLSEISGMPTPLPSSSPGHDNSQRLHQAQVRKQRQVHRDHAVDKAFVQPMRNRNTYDDNFMLGPPRKSRPPQNPRNEGRDIPEIRSGPANCSHRNVSLVLHEEPAEVVPSDKQIEDDFRARLRQAGEGLSPQYAPRVMAHQTRSEEGTEPSGVPVALHGAWTPINAIQPQENEPVMQMARKRRRTTEGRRTKSSRLPLEGVPEDYHTHNIVQRMSLSTAGLESLIYCFRGAFHDLNYADSAENQYYGLCGAHPEPTMSRLGSEAVELLRHKLRKAERSNDEEATLTFFGTLARLEKSDDVEIAA
jgi:hypothetical protein